MIKTLKIKNFAILKDIEINFSNGLNVITGETGAGKSLILKALKCLSGNKVDKELQNQSFDIQGIFYISKDVSKILEDFDIKSEDNELIIRRVATEKGNKNYVNGILVSNNILNDIYPLLYNFCGQNENVKIISEDFQRKLLDSYGTINTEEMEKKFKEYDKIKKKIEELELDEKNKEDKIEYLKFQLTDLEKLKFENINEQELEQQIKELKKFSLIKKVLSDFNEIETFDFSNKIEKIDAKLDSEFLKLKENIKNIKENYESLAIEFLKIGKRVKNNNIDENELQKKIEMIDKIKKKYGSIENLLSKKNVLKNQIEEMNNNHIIINKLKKEKEKKYNEYLKEADLVSKKRKEKAIVLSNHITKEIQDLNMKNAKFNIDISKEKDSLYGYDKITFMIEPNKGFGLKPLAKIASGGEMSRITLVLNKILSLKNSVEVLIFDEIDTGIGGETAMMVGQKINELSKKSQVVLISHLPQVSAYSNNHIYVYKEFDKNKNQTLSFIKILSHKEKIEEIARMIGIYSNKKDSYDSAIKHATELINNIN